MGVYTMNHKYLKIHLERTNSDLKKINWRFIKKAVVECLTFMGLMFSLYCLYLLLYGWGFY
jgi:hypothetical protein